MSHFAKVENGIVTQVIVIEQDVIDTGLWGAPASWIQTSYNTGAGVHRLGGAPLRKNYAGVGYTYDSTRDAFIPPQPYHSWLLNEDTAQWQAPVPAPTDSENATHYRWNESLINWEVEPRETLNKVYHPMV